MRKGIQTTEFWLSLLVIISPGFVLAFQAVFDQYESVTHPLIASLIAAAIAVFKYIGSRTDLKKSNGV